MDGLLVDTEPVHAAAYVAVFGEIGLPLTLEEYRQHITLGGGTIRDLYRERGGAPEAWPEVFARKCARFKRHVHEQVALLPGASELLSALTERCVPCVLATGAGRFNAQVVLDCFGLRRHFTLVLAGEDVKRAKPDPEVFLLAAEKLGVLPGECVSLEDSPKGVRAAVAAGVPCIAVPTEWTRTGEFAGAARVLGSLREVTPAMLAAVCREMRE